MCPETRERGKRGREKENARRTFFFLFALEVLNSTFFFTERASQEKSGKRRRVVFNSSNTILSLCVLYICACVRLLHPQSFFFCIYTRIWRLQTYINARKDRKEGKNLYEAENEWKTHELVSALARSRARSLSLSQY